MSFELTRKIAYLEVALARLERRIAALEAAQKSKTLSLPLKEIRAQ